MPFPPCEGVQGTVRFWIPRNGFRIPCTVHFLLMELVFWIPIVSGILQAQERFSLIPNSSGKNYEAAGTRIPLHEGRYILQQQHLRETSFWEMINTSLLDKDEP